MRTVRQTLLIGFAVLPLTACSIDVNENGAGRNSDVNIRTPIGNVSAGVDVDARDTGLPVYPGAREARNNDDNRESANVNVGNSWFGVKVVAAKFESDDQPQKIVDFYKREMEKCGAVTECRGDFDFEANRPVCDESGSSSEIVLVTGTEERQRLVAVKPIGRGSEFSLVYVETRGDR